MRTRYIFMQPHDEIHDEHQRRMAQTTKGDRRARFFGMLIPVTFWDFHPDSIGTGGWIRLVGGAIWVEGFRARCGRSDRLRGWESCIMRARLMPRGLLPEPFQLIVPGYFGSDRWPLLVPGSHPLRPHPRRLENKGKPACRLGEKVAWAVYRLTNISRSLVSLIRGCTNRWDADIWLVAFSQTTITAKEVILFPEIGNFQSTMHHNCGENQI